MREIQYGVSGFCTGHICDHVLALDAGWACVCARVSVQENLLIKRIICVRACMCVHSCVSIQGGPSSYQGMRGVRARVLVSIAGWRSGLSTAC